MSQASIAFIARATRFSPGSVDKDEAILSAVRQRLADSGFSCSEIVSEDQLTSVVEADAYVSMGRRQETLDWLDLQERSGRVVVNTPSSVLLCNKRAMLMRLLEENGIAVPPLHGTNGYWVKRGDGCRETPEDVQYSDNWEGACRLRDGMLSRGIADVDVRAHVLGRWLKFYGVRHTGFFYSYSPANKEDGISDKQSLQRHAERAARLAGLDVYGGDWIVQADGTPVLIDLNDWPSFSPCRKKASEAIAQRIIDRLEGCIIKDAKKDV